MKNNVDINCENQLEPNKVIDVKYIKYSKYKYKMVPERTFKTTPFNYVCADFLSVE